MDAIVQTRQGAVRGAVLDGVHTFKGIPFAAPPCGARRFLPPQPVVPWSGVRDALAFGPKAPQLPYPSPWDVLIPEIAASGDDCLTLNVWSPALGAAGRPVMVWIAGGTFEHGTGAAPMYDGSRFARDGIVCVTINYRVGADGFLFLPGATTNLGLLDQIAALTWVQENIARFGGDPGNVTIFGESAGAMSVGTLLSTSRAAGMFRRAIVQSGGAHQVISAAEAERVGRDFASRLGVASSREALAAVPTDRLLQAQLALAADLAADPDPDRWGAEVVISRMPWQPVIDGDLITASPLDLIASGAGADVDLMVGATADEWRFFLVPSGAIEHITADMLAAVAASYGLPVAAAITACRAMNPSASPSDMLATLQGDRYFRIPAQRLAEVHAPRSSATFMYEFAWRSPQYDGLLGACHGLELGFVFDSLGEGTAPMTGSDPPQALADTMHGAWVAFATHGDPHWPRYDLNRRSSMRFDTICKVVDDPWSRVRRLWEGVR